LAFAAIVVATAWPLAFLLDSGNIESVVVATLAGGILAFRRKRWYLAAVLIGLAGAMKLFPLALLGPFGLLAMYSAGQNSLVPGLRFCFGCFALPMTCGVLRGNAIEYSSLVRTVLLIALLVTVVRSPFPEQEPRLNAPMPEP
jgi:hypothetical protein